MNDFSNDFARQIDCDVTSVLDQFAPMQRVTKREAVTRILNWHSPQSLSDRRDCRRLERRFRRTGLQTDYREWRKAGRVMVKSLATARKEHFAHAINDSMITAKSKWSTIRNLLHMSNSVNMSLSFLTADRLNQFFNDKLCTIMSNISSSITSLSPPVPPVPSSAMLSQ